MENLKISRLQVQNFRNLYPEMIEFGSGINCIVGRNGNGKTNILEAIYFLSTKKSFRKKTGFPQILSIDGEKPEIIISSVFKDSENNMIPLSAKLEDKASSWFLDGKPIKRRPPIKVVFINPFDSYNFHQSASARRYFFDTHIGQLDDVYRSLMARYNNFLRQRNTLLSKRPSKYQEQIAAIDVNMARYNFEITQKRVEFINNLGPHLSEIFQELFSLDHTLEISLSSKLIGLTQEQIHQLMAKNLPEDERLGHTKLGIHRDDFIIFFDGINSLDYCSLGQQKITYLSLLFAYIDLFRYKFKTYPIVLIDDVSGELDELRWERLVSYLKRGNFQVLITTANDNFKQELEKIEDSTEITVSGGLMRNIRSSV
jgi:DNA replication and repair protein RecF